MRHVETPPTKKIRFNPDTSVENSGIVELMNLPEGTFSKDFLNHMVSQ